jgi:integrase
VARTCHPVPGSAAEEARVVIDGERSAAGGLGGERDQSRPKRRQSPADPADPSSRAGRRTVGLPDARIGLLRVHAEEQARERYSAGRLWQDEGWVFATPIGRPVDTRTDHDEGKRLLTASGPRDGRLHDARHTAATVLLLPGVTQRAVMGLMGWSTTAMAAHDRSGPAGRRPADRRTALD